MIAAFMIIWNWLAFCSHPPVEREVKVVFQPVYGNNVFVLNDSVYASPTAGEMRFSAFRYYISAIRLMQKGRLVLAENNSYHLVDADHPGSFTIPVKVPSETYYDEILFDIGIDSLTNVSGAMGGALDPTKGMYWTWQSGYINVKVEGTASRSKARKNEFMFHLGGYDGAFNALQTKKLSIHHHRDEIGILIDLKQLMDNTNVATTDHIMSPGAEAVLLSRSFAGCFKLAEK